MTGPDPTATVADILGCVADRFSIETCLRDTKDIVGAGQQQVRFLRANIRGRSTSASGWSP